MEQHLYSVDQVAERLSLHPRTVRTYVRDGRLKAVRIGKQYRIAHEDLEAFTGLPVEPPPRAIARRRRSVEVSSIVEIDVLSPEVAGRVSTLLMGSAAGRGQGERPLRIETAYDQERARLKVIVLGDLGDTAALLQHIEAVLET